MLCPLTKNGIPWYGGMRGFKDNTIVESLEDTFKNWANKSEYVQLLLGRYYTRITEGK